MIRRPPRSTPKPSSAASDVYKRQHHGAISAPYWPRVGRHRGGGKEERGAHINCYSKLVAELFFGSASTNVASYYHPTAQRHPLPRLWPQGPMSWTPLVCYTLVHTDCEYREKVPNFAPPEYHPTQPYARGLEPHAALLAGPSKLDAAVGACAIARRVCSRE